MAGIQPSKAHIVFKAARCCDVAKVASKPAAVKTIPISWTVKASADLDIRLSQVATIVSILLPNLNSTISVMLFLFVPNITNATVPPKP